MDNSAAITIFAQFNNSCFFKNLTRITFSLSLILIVIFPNKATGQYSLNTARETALIGTGAGLTATGFLFLNDFPDLSDQQIEDYYTTPKQFTFKFDKWATKQSSKKAKKWSDILLFSSILPPLALLIDQPKADDVRKKQGLMLLQTTLLNWGLTNVAKRTFRRPRPYMYSDDLYNFSLDTRRTPNSRQSFFSGHTSTTAAFYFFTAKTFSRYYPESSMKPFVWSTSIAIPALTGFLRVKAGKHFPTDVIIGYAVGALVGILIPELHQ
jgi:membrane-associated phospholipid phosphatase